MKIVLGTHKNVLGIRIRRSDCERYRVGSHQYKVGSYGLHEMAKNFVWKNGCRSEI